MSNSFDGARIFHSDVAQAMEDEIAKDGISFLIQCPRSPIISTPEIARKVASNLRLAIYLIPEVTDFFVADYVHFFDRSKSDFVAVYRVVIQPEKDEAYDENSIVKTVASIVASNFSTTVDEFDI
jgi:hypothetical protein